jgi:hypothetical protein
MSDDETKAQEEAFLQSRFGGDGLMSVSNEAIHDFVQQEHQTPETVNDIHTSSAAPVADGWTGSDTAQVISDVSTGIGLVHGDPVAVAELGAQTIEATMGPHGAEVEQHLGQYGGTLPDGGTPDPAAEGGHE